MTHSSALKTIGQLLWMPGGLGILCWQGVEEGNLLLILPALPLTPFALINLGIAFSYDLFTKKK